MGRAPSLTAQQRREIWKRWRGGETLSEVARELGRTAGTIKHTLAVHGGISPAPRRRSARALTMQEREEISRATAAGWSIRRIAAQLNRPASTISRELARNGGREQYRAEQAEARAWAQACRPKRCKLAQHRELAEVVAQRLMQKWSPQQIAGWLRREFPDDAGMSVSHETIYRSLYVQARGALKKELMAHLRTRRSMRHGKTATMKGKLQGQIVDAVSISERPPEAEDRAVPGHWEGDLLFGGKNTFIATLVERRSRYLVLVQLDDRKTETVVSALTREVLRLPQGLMASLTWDRGKEMAAHKTFSMATDVQMFFCDPQSPSLSRILCLRGIDSMATRSHYAEQEEDDEGGGRARGESAEDPQGSA